MLDEALKDALTGRGHVILLAGEPGTGKSRLAAELSTRAHARGAKVLVGRCWEAGGAPRYWPWIQALRALVDGMQPESLRQQVGGGAADLAELMPELRALFPGIAASPAIEPEAARFRMFESICTFLGRAAQASPLVIVLDDLHAADEPSLLLLRFGARGIAGARLLVICAHRDVDPAMSDPLSAAVAELVREPHARQVTLAGLGEAEVARYIECSSGETPSRSLTRSVAAETEGNPLFVVELVRLLVAERRLSEPHPRPAIPPGIRAVISRRVARLSLRSRGLLGLASVLGRDFSLDALGRMGQFKRFGLLQALDEALGEHVLDEVPGSPGRLRFAHVLIRDTLYDELSAPRRLELHREAAEALEAVYAADPEPHVAELAQHFHAAGMREKRSRMGAARATAPSPSSPTRKPSATTMPRSRSSTNRSCAASSCSRSPTHTTARATRAPPGRRIARPPTSRTGRACRTTGARRDQLRRQDPLGDRARRRARVAASAGADRAPRRRQPASSAAARAAGHEAARHARCGRADAHARSGGARDGGAAW